MVRNPFRYEYGDGVSNASFRQQPVLLERGRPAGDNHDGHLPLNYSVRSSSSHRFGYSYDFSTDRLTSAQPGVRVVEKSTPAPKGTDFREKPPSSSVQHRVQELSQMSLARLIIPWPFIFVTALKVFKAYYARR